MTLKPHYAVTPLQSFLKLTYDFSAMQMKLQSSKLKKALAFPAYFKMTERV